MTNDNIREVNIQKLVEATRPFNSMEVPEKVISEEEHSLLVGELNELWDEVGVVEVFSGYDDIYDEKRALEEGFNFAKDEYSSKAASQDAARIVASGLSAQSRKIAEEAFGKQRDRLDEGFREKKVEYSERIAPYLENERIVDDLISVVYPAPPGVFAIYQAIKNEQKDGQTIKTETLTKESKKLGPYAKMAEQISPLEIKRLRSIHRHTESDMDFVSAHDLYSSAVRKQEKDEKLSVLESGIVTVVGVLQTRYLERPRDLRFLTVYSPEEIFDINKSLMRFSRVDRSMRPDFGDIEGRIIDLAQVRKRFSPRNAEPDLAGAVKRMNNDSDGRLGLTWSKLNKYASTASDVIGGRLYSDELKRYRIRVQDPHATKPLNEVIQFIVDDRTLHILGLNKSSVQNQAKESFVENQQLIEDWLAKHDDLLRQLPGDLRFVNYFAKQKDLKRMDKVARKEVLESRSAESSIRHMVEDLKVRHREDGSALRHKPFSVDPIGAVRHQYVLMHKINELKEMLQTFGAKPDMVIEEVRELELDLN